MKPIPKSLHTVTVLYVMACQWKAAHPDAGPAECVASALDALGYWDSPDSYQLAAQTEAKLRKLPDFKGA